MKGHKNNRLAFEDARLLERMRLRRASYELKWLLLRAQWLAPERGK